MSRAMDDWVRVVETLLEGDRLAFLRINRLITGCLSQLRAYDFRDEWEDLRQEVLLSIVTSARAGRLRDAQAFVAYVRSITRHKFFDRLGKAERRHEKQQVPWDEDAAAEASTGVDCPAADVWRAVADLPPQHQQVLDGVYRQGKTYDEVARDSGIPLGTVKRRLREGLDELRHRFKEDPTHD